MTFNRILLDSTKLDRVPQPWEFTCRITIVIDLLRDLDKRKEGRGKEEKEKKKRFCKRVRNLKSKRRRATRLSSRLETLTFVSRAEVHCYENQLSVKRRMERWNATNAYVMDVRFLSPMESRRSPKWQVAAPASGSEIRDATTSRGWKGRRRNSLRVVPYKTVDPSWAGTSGLWLRIHLVQELWKCSSLFYRWKRRTVGGNLSRRVLLNKLFSLPLSLFLFFCSREW